MPLTLLTATSEKIVGPEVERRIREAMEATGRAVLLVPSFPQALDAQRELAVMGGLALGVTVTTVEAWAEERWEVWGDGSRLVDDASRDVLASRVLARAAWRPGSALVDTPGAAALLADLAREGLPWLASAPAPEGGDGRRGGPRRAFGGLRGGASLPRPRGAVLRHGRARRGA